MSRILIVGIALASGPAFAAGDPICPFITEKNAFADLKDQLVAASQAELLAADVGGVQGQQCSGAWDRYQKAIRELQAAMQKQPSVFPGGAGLNGNSFAPGPGNLGALPTATKDPSADPYGTVAPIQMGYGSYSGAGGGFGGIGSGNLPGFLDTQEERDRVVLALSDFVSLGCQAKGGNGGLLSLGFSLASITGTALGDEGVKRGGQVGAALLRLFRKAPNPIQDLKHQNTTDQLKAKLCDFKRALYVFDRLEAAPRAQQEDPAREPARMSLQLQRTDRAARLEGAEFRCFQYWEDQSQVIRRLSDEVQKISVFAGLGGGLQTSSLNACLRLQGIAAQPEVLANLKFLDSSWACAKKPLRPIWQKQYCDVSRSVLPKIETFNCAGSSTKSAVESAAEAAAFVSGISNLLMTATVASENWVAKAGGATGGEGAYEHYKALKSELQVTEAALASIPASTPASNLDAGVTDADRSAAHARFTALGATVLGKKGVGELLGNLHSEFKKSTEGVEKAYARASDLAIDRESRCLAAANMIELRENMDSLLVVDHQICDSLVRPDPPFLKETRNFDLYSPDEGDTKFFRKACQGAIAKSDPAPTGLSEAGTWARSLRKELGCVAKSAPNSKK